MCHFGSLLGTEFLIENIRLWLSIESQKGLAQFIKLSDLQFTHGFLLLQVLSSRMHGLADPGTSLHDQLEPYSPFLLRQSLAAPVFY